jgi:hypothetical protein
MQGRALFTAMLVVGWLGAACGGSEKRAPPAPRPALPGPAILFVGNSLTDANDLPGMVEGLAAAAGVTLPTAQVAIPNYSLGDHLADGEAPDAIAAGGWRVVILQQGPSGQPDSRIQLRDDAAAFDALVRAAGARTALFSVWADSQGPSTFEQVRASYSLAAANVGAIYFPVNEAWSLAWERKPALDLYSADGFHPAVEGSYLAALVITGMLTGIPPTQLPATFTPPRRGQVIIDAADASVLRDSAAAAIASFGRR